MGRSGIINKYVIKGRSILWLDCNFYLPEKKKKNPMENFRKNPLNYKEIFYLNKFLRHSY